MAIPVNAGRGSTAREEHFVTCAPGIEPFLHAEMRALGFGQVERQVGGVRFVGTRRDAWRANLELRTAVRVLQRVARFEARDADQLYAGAREVDWSRWLRPTGKLRVDARASESALEHTLFVEQKTKDAICDGFRARGGERPAVDLDDADLGVYVHLHRDRCTLLVDTSGDSLHKRGWRRFQGVAPLAETLAAALVLASHWDRRAPLLDPFCGSGTIPIEAALLAGDVAPGLFRARFGFERWIDHDAAGWKALVDAARTRARHPPKLVLVGSDADASAIAGARQNAEAAGLEGRIEFRVARVEALDPKKGWNAWIATNLPYGERVGDARELAPVCRRFGEILRTRCAGYHATILSGNVDLTRALGLQFLERHAVRNGAIECELLSTRL